MKKQLKRVGNSWVLVLGKEILGLLKINPVVDEVELEIEKIFSRLKNTRATNIPKNRSLTAFIQS